MDKYVYLKYEYIKNNIPIKLLFSYNLMYLVSVNSINFIIIELKPKIFLLELFSLVEYYMPIAPIYNERGILINDSVFTTSVKKLDLNIFNIAFESNDFNYLFRYNLDGGKLDLEMFNIALESEVSSISLDWKQATTKLIINLGTILFNKPVETQEILEISSDKLISLIYLINKSFLEVFNIPTLEIIPIITFFETKTNKSLFLNEIMNEMNMREVEYMIDYEEYIKGYIKQRPLNVPLMYNKPHESDMIVEEKTFPKILFTTTQSIKSY
jgi:hypothetical protein